MGIAGISNVFNLVRVIVMLLDTDRQNLMEQESVETIVVDVREVIPDLLVQRVTLMQ